MTTSKNRYAVALLDIYNPEILFGEVLLIPLWAQPTLSQEEIRLQGGVPPAPQPMLPTEFTIQLYNPDQQVVTKLFSGTWNTAPYWEFDLPQQSFRQPSNSALDRTQNDPTAAETTPKTTFRWKKDGKLSKDYVCSMVGKSTAVHGNKRKHKEPDIAIALFRHLKEITIYEPNLSRTELEDLKGLEVVLLLGAMVLRDVFNGPLNDVFNIAEPPRRSSNDTSSKQSLIIGHGLAVPIASTTSPVAPSASQFTQMAGPMSSGQPESHNPLPPPMDPRSQWEIDVETARLKKEIEQEERERQRAEQAEMKRLKKMLDAEEREARRKQAEIDKETERLKKIYAVEQQQIRSGNQPSIPSGSTYPQQSSAFLSEAPIPRPRSAAARTSVPKSQPYHMQQISNLQASTHGPSPGGPLSGHDESRGGKAKKVISGLRSFSDEYSQRLTKKKSALW